MNNYMNLEDLMIDYIAVYPNGNLSYVKNCIKDKSNIQLINFVRIIEDNINLNNYFYNSIYIKEFLLVIKNEYNKRVQNKQIKTLDNIIDDISNKQLSSSAEEFIPNYLRNFEI